MKTWFQGLKPVEFIRLNAQELLKKLPSQSLPEDINTSVSDVVLEQLRSMGTPKDAIKACQRRKVNVEPGKSVSAEEFQNDAAAADETSDESDESDVSGSSDSSSDDGDKEMETETASTIPTELKELTYCNVSIGQWVKVLYEGEVFLGKVLKKENNEYFVQCLEKPYGIREPQTLEKECQSAFYEQVFETDIQPKLTKVGRGWKYTY